MNWQIENLKIVCGDNGKFVSITPELASLLLSLPSIEGEENRKVSHSSVSQYARDMVAEKWKRSHSPIIIGKNNVLINGQHRLLAIIKSESTVEMFVVFDDYYGFPRDYLGDEPVKRSSAYTLHLTTREASLAREFVSICKKNFNPSKSEIELGWQKIKPFYEKAIIVQSHKKVIGATTFTLGVIAAAEKSGDYEYCSKVYGKMNAAEQNMPPLAFSLYRQLVIDAKAISEAELLAKVFRGFDPSKANTAKLVIQDHGAAHSEAIEILRSLLTR